MENQNIADQELWRIARKRVGFKKHLAAYIVINAFFWGIWWFSDERLSENDEYSAIPWPIFSMLGWGVGLMMNFLSAYVFYNKHSSIEREYEKLKNKK
ncbi:MAG: 2TM domain-containing protein [Bacteroidetes bacterium]|nr:2TM domain-containing protein [Bacteroidota bacterium]